MVSVGLRKLILYNFLFILSFLVLIMFITIGSLGNNITNSDKIIINEFGEFDLLFACKINSCSYIRTDNKIYKLKNDEELIEAEDDKFERIVPFNYNTYLTKNKQIEITYNNTSIYIPFNEFLKRIYEFLGGIIPIFLIFDLYIVFIEYKKIKLNQKKKWAHIHSHSYNHSLMVLVENLNHEIQTPLKVLDFKIKKINKNLGNVFKFVNSFDKKNCGISNEIINLSESIEDVKIDMRLINGALEHLWNILKKLKNFKQIKEENNSIGATIELALDLFLVTQSEKFKYHIEDRLFEIPLVDYKLDSGSLTSVIINLAKNSLEHGKAYFIKIYYKLADEHIELFLEDDGDGINEGLKNKIFKENFSTSSSKYKGNGLFINNALIEDKGEINLVGSEPGKTTFSIKLWK